MGREGFGEQERRAPQAAVGGRAQGPAQPRAAQAGLILTTAHTSPFPSPERKEHISCKGMMTLQCSKQLSQWPGGFPGGEASKTCVFPPKGTFSISWVQFQTAPVRNTQIHLAPVLSQQDKGTEDYAPKGHLSICRQLSGNAHLHM